MSSNISPKLPELGLVCITASKDTYEDPSVYKMLTQARTTWEVPEWQLVHISNGEKFFSDPRHSDFIDIMPSSYKNAPWIEVEAKQKELAIARLRKHWFVNLSFIL